MFGKDLPGKERRVEWARNWVHSRSGYAIAAGMLGIMAPVDGIIFFILPLAAIIVGVLGLRDIKQHPHLLGKRLCYLGFAGGVIGLTISAYLVFLQ